MISKPNVNISITSANNVLDIGARRDLIVCQVIDTAANILHTGIEDLTQTELDSLFTAGSYCRVMVQQWLDANQVGNNVKAKLDVIALKPEGAATAATKVITVVGTATAAGTIVVDILSSKLYSQTITVSVDDDETAVADAITAAYSGVVAPFTVDNTAGVVTVTVVDLGTIGNDYGIEVSNLIAGISSIAITDGVTGATPPVVTAVMDLVGSTRYQGILWPSDLRAELDEVTTDFLDGRFNTSNDILDGVAFMGEAGTLAGLKVIAGALNSQSLVIIGNEITGTDPLKDGPEIVHPVDWTVASFMAIRARRLTEGASITSIVTANASGDQFGGKSSASLPYFNTPLADVPITNSVNVFDSAEQAELNITGFSVVGPNKPVTDTITGAIVTTYKTDAAGNDDVSFKYLNYVDTASVCREFLFTNFKSLFAQTRLTDGDLVAGRAMENAASLKAAFKGLLGVLKDAVLIRDGRTADKLVDDSLEVELDLAGRSATINSVLPIVTQLETINVVLQMSFTL